MLSFLSGTLVGWVSRYQFYCLLSAHFGATAYGFSAAGTGWEGARLKSSDASTMARHYFSKLPYRCCSDESLMDKLPFGLCFPSEWSMRNTSPAALFDASVWSRNALLWSGWSRHGAAVRFSFSCLNASPRFALIRKSHLCSFIERQQSQLPFP